MVNSNRVEPRVAASAMAVPTSRLREIAEMAMKMDGVLKLYFGESNIPTAPYIKQAAIKAMDDGYTVYTPNAGLMSTREAIAAYYFRMHGVTLDPGSEIVMTAGGLQALNVAIRCVLDPGDEAIVITPAFPDASSIVVMANAKLVEIAHPLMGNRYGFDFEKLERAVTARTKLLVYTSPSNPLGWVATVAEQQQILEFARRHGLWLLADEVYERLCYDVPVVPSILRLATRDDAVMVAQSFSKTYCMTGWRVGWLVARRDVAARATQLNEFIICNAPSIAQRACETALADGEDAVHALVEQLKKNRDFCLGALASIPGLTVPQSNGAFYLFPKVEGLTDSLAFCKRFLLERKVGLAPGAAFGVGGEGSVRISYASEMSVLEPAMERFATFMRGWR